MRNVIVKVVPILPCCNERGVELLHNFNIYATDNKDARLQLSMLKECETLEDLASELDEGMYEYIYPQNNPYSKDLEKMVEELDNHCWHLYFDLECLDL